MTAEVQAAPASSSLSELADRILGGHELTHAEALGILATPDADTLHLAHEAFRLRRAHFGLSVKVNYLVNLKSGLCPEDCTYCSQRLGSDAEILKYTWLKPEEAVRQAKLGIGGGARRVCMVASGRGPTDRDVERVAGMVATLKDEHPEIEVCACLGLLKDGQAERLKDVGVDAYNHNINTAESHYDDICSTHTYEDRLNTVQRVQGAGMSACSGLIVGMGESDEQLVEAVFALRDMGSDSIPVNFLMPFDGTPLAGTWELSPLRALRILALVRFAAPDRELRMAGGREMHLRSLQPVALQVANSLFLGDYLTSEGQSAEEDLAMIRDNGFHVLGEEPGASAPARADDDAGGCCDAGGCSDEPDPADVAPVPAASALAPQIRRRGAGTDAAPNA
jgi:biotin synthase